MKSTLKIGLYGDNTPMIVASVSTDRSDLRDSVMNKFFDSLEGNFEESDNTQSRSCLCFVEGFGREHEPEAYIHTIHAIRPGKEDRYMNLLQLSQAKRMIPLLFEMFGSSDRKEILTLLNQIDKETVQWVDTSTIQSVPSTKPKKKV